MSSYCYYYLSGYPGESFSSPNAFLLQQCSGSSGSGVASTDWTFGDIKDSFPVKEGEYYFRFRKSDGGGGFNWIDVRQDDYNAKVPKFQGCVFAKVLRLDKLPRLTPTKMRLNAKKARQKQQRNTSPHPNNSNTTSNNNNNNNNAPRNNTTLPLKNGPTKSFKKQKHHPLLLALLPLLPSLCPVLRSFSWSIRRSRRSRRRFGMMLIRGGLLWGIRGIEVGVRREKLLPSPPTSSAALPQTTQHNLRPPAQNAATNSKTLGVSLSASNAVGKSANVAAAVHARVQEMEDAQEKAVKELRDREKQKVKDAEEMDEVRARLEPKIKEWSEEYGKKRQLRALLSSLDKVLWPESSWKPINLGDILDSKKARRAYLKASLKVHPDKTKNLLPDQKFIATGVFDALSQANAEFEAKGGM
ncbi:hypothetical protein TL16_g06242, partial [Triparma laevis f. inornata]